MIEGVFQSARYDIIAAHTSLNNAANNTGGVPRQYDSLCACGTFLGWCCKSHSQTVKYYFAKTGIAVQDNKSESDWAHAASVFHVCADREALFSADICRRHWCALTMACALVAAHVLTASRRRPSRTFCSACDRSKCGGSQTDSPVAVL